MSKTSSRICAFWPASDRAAILSWSQSPLISSEPLPSRPIKPQAISQVASFSHISNDVPVDRLVTEVYSELSLKSPTYLFRRPTVSDFFLNKRLQLTLHFATALT